MTAELSAAKRKKEVKVTREEEEFPLKLQTSQDEGPCTQTDPFISSVTECCSDRATLSYFNVNMLMSR